MRFFFVVLFLPLPFLACTSNPPEATSPGPAPDVVNRTDKERSAFRSNKNRGILVLSVKDVETGKPVIDCDYHSARFSFEQHRVAPQFPMMLDGPRRPGSEEGRYRWDLAGGWHQIRVDAKGYRNTWTPVFMIEAGKETTLNLTMRKANRIKIIVLDENGKPVPEGGVRLAGKNFRAGMHIEKGVGERLVPVDEITVSVGDIFMKDYASQKVTVPLRAGIVNEITIRLRR